MSRLIVLLIVAAFVVTNPQIMQCLAFIPMFALLAIASKAMKGPRRD